MTLASLQQQKYSVWAMAGMLDRAPSTVSRELSRNADASGYTCSQAQKRCQHRRQSARPQRRLHVGTSLFGVVHHFLLVRWSPVCAKPTTNEHRAAKVKTDDARFPTRSASVCVHLRLKTGSYPGTGRATSSKARPMRVPWAHWSNEQAGC